jgi:2-dehydropantoate 2-reductase
MGCIYGAALHESGLDVRLVDVSPAVVREVASNGVTITRGGVERHSLVPITADAAAIGTVDMVVFFTKCYQTQEAAKGASSLVGPQTAVVSLQNGWGNGEVLAQAFGRERVCVGVSYHSATALGPGRVLHTAWGRTLLGALDSGDALAEQAGELLSLGGLEVRVTAEVRHEIWKKLTLNAAALPTSALTGLVAGDLAQPGGLLDVVDEIAREAVAAGRAAGFLVDEDERLTAIHDALRSAGNGKASMLQDIEAGRRTEIEVINGAVVAAGARAGVPTPMNAAMVALIDGYERGHGLK